ncbi:MAG: GNAT family N-acetyltransferase, partial [Caldilineaceae bacterium]
GAHAESPATVLRLLRTEHALLAEAQGAGVSQPVGCVFFAPNTRRAPAGVREVYLHRLGVLPAWRRRGIATGLMDAAEQWASDSGFESVALGVRVALPANRHFYEARGYRVSEFTAHAGYARSTAIIMRKPLVPPPPRQVIVSEWTTAWSEGYERAAAQIRHLLEDELLATFHVGSTAVRGLAAKPTIDILAVVRSLDAAEARDEALWRAGWLPFGAFGIPGRRFYRKGDEALPTHHLHLYRSGHPEISAHLALVAYLNTHPDEAAAYCSLKQRLAAEYPWEISAYLAGKADYLPALRDRALAWWQVMRAP